MASKKKPKPFNNPFASLAPQLKKALKKSRKAALLGEVERHEPPPPPPSAQPESEPDEDAFMRAVGDAVRVNTDPRGQIKPELPPADASAVVVYDEDAEALAELASLIDGTGHFDISDSDEFIEGCAEGLDRRILRRLKRGDYAVRAHLDLHGLTREPARAAVDTFFAEAKRAQHRCVLIVHGRGLNSKDNIPVLKGLLKSWLERGRFAKQILAFCTAQNHDGGAGAVYVLLRK